MWFRFLAGVAVLAQVSSFGVPNDYRRSYDPAADGTSESLTLRLDPPELNLQVAIVYSGKRRKAVPHRVELLISSDRNVIGNARTLELSVALHTDARAFSCGSRNARDVTSANAVALLCTYDEFRTLADATVASGEAFGIAFSISPERLVALHDLADHWATPE